MALALVFGPLALALVALALPPSFDRRRGWLLPVGGAAHLALVVIALRAPEVSALEGWLVLDRLGRLILPFLSLLFFVTSIYAVGYLAQRPERRNSIFCASLLALLGMMTLITLSHHLGLMWVALEANTLASAPLLYFEKTPRALEATWKYLLLGSVGIALALLGSFFLAYAALKSGLQTSLFFEDLVREAPRLSRPWLHAAFVLLLVGYGTKMGLAPMHTWKPDAYGEAPGLVGTLLAGGLAACAFVALLRFFQICGAAGEAEFARQIMIAIGLFSMAVAGVFLVRQRDYKRMLAYSSVEHMGILVLGVGVGGAGVFGALFHLVGNGLTKGLLFLAAGNLHRAYGSRSTEEVTGALRLVPLSGALFLAGFFAVTGSPPFAPFLSELTIVRAAFEGGHPLAGALFLGLGAIVFVGMGGTVMSLVQGEPPAKACAAGYRDSFLTVAPAAALLGLVLLLGVWLPGPAFALIDDAAKFVEARP